MDILTITGPVSVALKPMSDDEFFEFCQRNDDLRIERTAEGEIVVKPLLGLEAGSRNFGIIVQLGAWAEEDDRGRGFGSNTGFTLPNRAVRSPDAAWISNQRMDAIADDDIEKFAHVCPEFVIKLLSPSDSLPALQRKIQEWIENGAELGWLIDPFERVVFEYTRNGMRKIDAPDDLASTGPVEGFRLRLGKIWKRR
jgi:Uma2 family endonuclease